MMKHCRVGIPRYPVAFADFPDTEVRLVLTSTCLPCNHHFQNGRIPFYFIFYFLCICMPAANYHLFYK